MNRKEKLAKAQKEHRQLLDERKPIVTEYNRVHRKLLNINDKIRSKGQAIYALKHDGETPEVTDHAVVRYLERVKGVDILDLKAEVANHKNAHREGNVVVTVNPTQQDKGESE